MLSAHGRAAAAALALAAGTLASAGPAAASTRPLPTVVPRCTVGVLRLTHTPQDIGAGSGGEFLVFANTGRHSCSLDGHPRVAYVGPEGHQVGAAAVRFGLAVRVVLEPGQSASAELLFVDVTSAEPGCQNPSEEHDSLGERVYPPGSARALYVVDPHPACRSDKVHLLRIGAVT